MANDRNNNNDVVKDFGLTKWAVHNRTTVVILTLLIFLAGIGSYISMPKESFPEVVIPEIYVNTIYPGNSPADIEKLITRPIEKEINAISGIDEMKSTSKQGVSTIHVKFDFSVTPEEALRKVKDKVDIAMSDPDFPDDLPADPNVFDLNFSEIMPVMNVNISGNFSLDRLNAYAEYLEEKIEDIPQINAVDIRGVNDKEVKVELDLLRMAATQVSFKKVADAIKFENMTISGGDIEVDGRKRSIRVIGEFTDWRDIENIIVKHDKGNIVYLRDIGTVDFGEEDKESYAREYTHPVVSLDVKKRAGENLIEASEAINEVIEEAKKTVFPENLSITITNNQSEHTITQVDELENSIIFGIILVIGVLMFFLGMRNALFVGIAIPLSMMMSFMLLGFLGVTLNMMVLFSLVLALGMLVDNGIVVVENVYRLMDEGMKPVDAAIRGASEVAWPIIASTATTLAAFVPLALWPGMMGEFMRYLPITLIIVLSSSLFVALVINPVLTSLYMKIHETDDPVSNTALIIAYGSLLLGWVLGFTGTYYLNETLHTVSYFFVAGALIFLLFKKMFIAPETNKKRVTVTGVALIIISIFFLLTGESVSGNFIGVTGTFLILNVWVFFPMTEKFQNSFIPKMERGYDRFIRYALSGKKPVIFLTGTFLLLIFSFFLVSVAAPKVIFFPDNEPQYLNIFIEKPIGTSIERTNETTKEIEKIVLDAISKYNVTDPNTGEEYNFLVNSVIAQVGKGTSDPRQGFVGGSTPNRARITVSFVKYQDRRGVNTNDVLTDLRERLANLPGVKITVTKNEIGPPAGAPINIEITGDDYNKLLNEANNIIAFIENAGVSGIEELKLDVEQGKPEMPVKIDRAKARRLGISTGQIGDAIRTSLFGKEVSTYKSGEDDYPINIRAQKVYRDNPEALMNQRITFRNMNNGRIVQVPISALATAKHTSTFSAVKRKDMKRVVTISSNVLEGYNANEVVAEIKDLLKSYELPPEYGYKFTGEQEEQAKQMAFLSKALLIAFSLIIMIIIFQFNAVSSPFIIGTSVFFSMIGVLLGLVIFQMDFVIMMTMIGIISLAGIVVNNAIVLIDYTNIIIDRKKVELGIPSDEPLPFKYIRECVEEGGRIRMRPVLLTAITTVLGLVPLAIGLNIDFFKFFTELDPNVYMGGDNVSFWGPMSWTIIFGLTFATFLTLIIVPVMYYISKQLKYKWVYKMSIDR